MSDVQEMKEAAVAIVVLIKEIQTLAKDGLQFSDTGSFVLHYATDKVFRDKVTIAFEGLSKIPAEWKELDTVGGLEIITAIIEEIRTPGTP